MIELSSDLNTGNQRDLQRLLDTMDSLEHPGSWNGDHHHASRVFIAFNGGNLLPSSVAQNQFFKADTRAKFQHGRAKPPDGASGNLQHPRALLVHPQLALKRAIL